MKLIDELCKFFKIKNINSSKDNKDTDNTKEIMYYSTDKNSFVTSRIPKNIKIVTKKHNSCTYIDYDINTYYNNKDKHISNNSYFVHYPNTIINYKNKLQETGLTLENNENRIKINEIDTIDEVDSTDNVDSTDEVDSTDNVGSTYRIDSSDTIDDYLYQYYENECCISNEKFIKIEESKRLDMYKFYNTLNKNNDNKTWSIYSNLN